MSAQPLLRCFALLTFSLAVAISPASAQIPDAYKNVKTFSYEELGITPPQEATDDRLFDFLLNSFKKTSEVLLFCLHTKPKADAPETDPFPACLCANLQKLFDIKRERVKALNSFLQSRPDFQGKDFLIKKKGEQSGLFVRAEEQKDISPKAFQESFSCR